ncbi:hypothetical protein LTR94_035163, partial [Friedmanniomyces endolithicus]
LRGHHRPGQRHPGAGRLHQRHDHGLDGRRIRLHPGAGRARRHHRQADRPGRLGRARGRHGARRLLPDLSPDRTAGPADRGAARGGPGFRQCGPACGASVPQHRGEDRRRVGLGRR